MKIFLKKVHGNGNNLGIPEQTSSSSMIMFMKFKEVLVISKKKTKANGLGNPKKRGLIFGNPLGVPLKVP